MNEDHFICIIPIWHILRPNSQPTETLFVLTSKCILRPKLDVSYQAEWIVTQYMRRESKPTINRERQQSSMSSPGVAFGEGFAWSLWLRFSGNFCGLSNHFRHGIAGSCKLSPYLGLTSVGKSGLQRSKACREHNLLAECCISSWQVLQLALICRMPLKTTLDFKKSTRPSSCAVPYLPVQQSAQYCQCQR